PVDAFLDLLRSAIASGRAHLQGIAGEEPDDSSLCGWEGAGVHSRPKGPLVGWLGADEVLLEPESAFAAARRLGDETDRALTISLATLEKRLAEQGLLLTSERGGERRLRQRRTVRGGQHLVLVLPRAMLVGVGPANPASDDQ